MSPFQFANNRQSEQQQEPDGSASAEESIGLISLDEGSIPTSAGEYQREISHSSGDQNVSVTRPDEVEYVPGTGRVAKLEFDRSNNPNNESGPSSQGTEPGQDLATRLDSQEFELVGGATIKVEVVGDQAVVSIFPADDWFSSFAQAELPLDRLDDVSTLAEALQAIQSSAELTAESNAVQEFHSLLQDGRVTVFDPPAISKLRDAEDKLNQDTLDTSEDVKFAGDFASYYDVVDIITKQQVDWTFTLDMDPPKPGQFSHIAIENRAEGVFAVLQGRNSLDQLTTIELSLGAQASEPLTMNLGALFEAVVIDAHNQDTHAAADLKRSGILLTSLFSHLEDDVKRPDLNPHGIKITRLENGNFDGVNLAGGIFKDTVFENCRFKATAIAVSGDVQFINCNADKSTIAAVGQATNLSFKGSSGAGFSESVMLTGTVQDLTISGKPMKFAVDAMELDVQGSISADYLSKRDVKKALTGMRLDLGALDKESIIYQCCVRLSERAYASWRSNVFMSSQVLLERYSNSDYVNTFPSSHDDPIVAQQSVRFRDGAKAVQVLTIENPLAGGKSLAVMPVRGSDRQVALFIVNEDFETDPPILFKEALILDAHNADVRICEFIQSDDPLVLWNSSKRETPSDQAQREGAKDLSSPPAESRALGYVADEPNGV